MQYMKVSAVKVLLLLCLPLYATGEQQHFSLDTAINLALEHNYDIKKQRAVLAQAQGQYKKAKGNLDIQAAVQGQYNRKQNPVDERDPDYQYGYSWLTPDTNYGVYCDNTLTEQAAGTVFLQKLFSFGLHTKLSYTIQKQKNTPYYSYGSNFDTKNYSKYKEEEWRNNGTVGLELSFPLFKSFADSLASLQLHAAHDAIEQMEASLNDVISQTIITVSNRYWNYFISWKNVEQIEILQNKIEDRNKNMDQLIRAGVRSKNDMLAMQVNVNENRRQLQEARVQFKNSKMELLSALGIADSGTIGIPENPFDGMDTSFINAPRIEDISEEVISLIIEERKDIVALKKRMDSAALRLKSARVDKRPDADLNFGISAAGASYSDDNAKFFTSPFWNIHGADISGSVSVSARLFNSEKRGAEMEAQADYDMCVSDYTKAVNTLTLQIQNAAEKLDIYQNLVNDADEVLTLQKSLYENEQKRFNAGLITVDTLLSQDQKYINAELSYYQVLINYLQAILEFKYYSANLISIDTEIN